MEIKKSIKKTKCLLTVLLALLCAAILDPSQAQAQVVFEDIPVYCVNDMRDYDQVVGLSWKLDWNLNEDAGVTEQKRYAKFSLAQDSFVRIKMSADHKGFAAENYFRLYGNESMAVPLTDNDMFGGGDDYFYLKAGTYYAECGSKLYMSSSSVHSTKIMIGAVSEEQGVQILQTVSGDGSKVNVTVVQKFASQINKAKWCEGRVEGMTYRGEDIDSSNTFTVDKNGWYTVYIKSESSAAFNKDVEYYTYFEVTGISEGIKKGVSYAVGNLKYELAGKGSVMVAGMNNPKASVTIPQTVRIQGQNYKVVKIKNKAFYKKKQIKKITIKSKNITSIGKNAFKGINKKAVFKVPKSKYKSYKGLLTSKTGFAAKTMKIKK